MNKKTLFITLIVGLLLGYGLTWLAVPPNPDKPPESWILVPSDGPPPVPYTAPPVIRPIVR